MQKSASNLVIFPSRVRPIPFTIPGLDEDDCARWASEPSLDSARPEENSDVISRLSNRISMAYVRSVNSLGNLDPALYNDVEGGDNGDILAESNQFDDDNIGRVWFALEYNPDSERLVVNLIQVKHLQSRVPGSSNACDPFVRISLLPDERRWMQSKAKRKTCNPTFDEAFVFQISHKDFDERAVKLTVYDVDRHRRHVTLGHVVYPLKGHVYDERIVVWRDLERELIQPAAREASELQLSLCYNDTVERLTIAVFSGRNFHAISTNYSPSVLAFYVKISLTIPKQETKKKRTATVKHHLQTSQLQQLNDRTSISLIFNESFTFKLPANYLDTASVIVTVMQASRTAHRDKALGRVVLGSFMFARGPELEHWTDMTSTPKQQLCRWHKLS